MKLLSRLVRRAAVGLGSGLTLANLADELAGLHGDALAVTEQFPDGRVRALSHAQMATTVDRWSAAVVARTKPGDPVVVATPNGIDQLMVCLAVARAGRLPAPVNSRMTQAEIDHVIADCDAALVVRDAEELTTGPGSRSAAVAPCIPDHDEVAALFYTSGTTGKPKGAELTHSGLVGQMSAAALVPPVLGGNEVLLSLPVAHIMGFVALLAPLVLGVPIYFLDHFTPTAALDVIERRQISAFMGVPAMYRMLLEAGARDRDLSSVRVWMSGADVMPADLAKEFKDMGATLHLPFVGSVGQASFCEGYGMVEVAGGVAAKVSPPFLPVGLGDSLGLRLPGWQFRVVGDDGEPVGAGQVGELLVKGPGVLKGYRGDAGAGAAVLTDDGWLHTGDLVRSGLLGTVVFHGRSKHVVKSGGYSVYPVEVEAVLEEHPEVTEAVVIGLPDPKLGEVTAAVVRLRAGSDLTAEQLVEWVGQRMAGYKAPRKVVVVDDLPRTGTRKVQRDKLLALFDAT